MMNKLKLKIWCAIEDKVIDVERIFFDTRQYKPVGEPNYRFFINGELMIYSGLDDENGIEIYSGHKVCDAHQDLSGTVVLEDGAFMVKWDEGNCMEFLSDCHRQIYIQGCAYNNIYKRIEELNESLVIKERKINEYKEIIQSILEELREDSFVCCNHETDDTKKCAYCEGRKLLLRKANNILNNIK